MRSAVEAKHAGLMTPKAAHQTHLRMFDSLDRESRHGHRFISATNDPLEMRARTVFRSSFGITTNQILMSNVVSMC